MIKQEFNDIIGHAKLLEYLSNKIETKTLSNIILLVGVQGIGKTSIAKRIALCLEGTNNNKDNILNGKDTENVKFFNMSVLKSDEEIRRVCANFTRPISGSKILILDECHGMTLEQQDSLLTQLEHLPGDLYVIFCTTEISRIREALLSRIKATFKLNNLSRSELMMLCKKLLVDNNVNYDGTIEQLASRLCKFSNGDARLLHNTIEEIKSFNPVTEEVLETLVGTDDIVIPLMLVQLLEVNILQGFTFLNNLVIDNNLRQNCNTLLSILCGNLNISLSKLEQDKINSLNKMHYNIYCNFLCDIMKDKFIDQSKLTAIFYEYSKKIASTNIDLSITSDNKKQQIQYASNDDLSSLIVKDAMDIDSLLEVEK